MADSTTTHQTIFTAKADQFKSTMASMSSSLYSAGGIAGRFGAIARQSTGLATIGFTSVGIAARQTGKFIASSIALYVEYNDTLARTTAVLGSTAEESARLDAEIKNVGRTTRFTASQVGETANMLAIAGVSADEMISDQALRNLVNFAIAGGVDIQTATNIGIAGVKAFGMEMSELTKVSDVMTRTFTRSNVDIVSIGEAIKFVGPVAHSARLEIEEITAGIGALGNAGLRGTVAGTGLRMAINKLLKPTFDARKVMNDLGLNVARLTPAGESANNTLKRVTRELDSATREADSLNTSMRELNGMLSDMSIEQQANSLAIEQIRARASRNARELTKQEIETIARLEGANENLRLSEMELSLERARTQRSLDEVNHSQRVLKEQSTELNRTVEQQTSGITSLSDVLNQLSSSGATTTQILEVFGVRGGTAIASLLSQKDAFDQLVQANRESAGATADYIGALQGQADSVESAKEGFFLLKSQIEEAMLTIAKPFVDVLLELSKVFGEVLNEAITENKGLFEELALMMGDLIRVVVPLVISAIPDLINIMKGLVPILMVVAFAFRLIIGFIAPFFQLISGLYNLLASVMKGILLIVKGIGHMIMGEFGKAKDTFGQILDLRKQFMTGLKDTLVGGAFSMLNMSGMGMVRMGGAKMLAGAGGKEVMMGGFKRLGASQVGSTGTNMGLNMFADGGLITSPTLAMMGEDGAEAVVPLSASKSKERQQVMNEAGLGGSITIGDIVINGNADSGTVNAIRDIVYRELPKVLRQEQMRGARGVI